MAGRSIPAAKRTQYQSTVKLSIRFTRAEVEQLSAGARSAGLSRAAYLAGLVANVHALRNGGATRPECLGALTASSGELATLSRNIYHLTASCDRVQCVLPRNTARCSTRWLTTCVVT